MYRKMKHLLQEERGLSALETAIVLIAFVVVAAVFAFTMLSAGMFSTERSKEAVYAGLEEVRGSMELRGSVVATATTTGAAGSVDTLIFTVSNVAGGEPIDMTDTDGDNKIVIDYRDGNQLITGLDWDISWPVRQDTDNLLEDGELAEIQIPGLESNLDPDLGISTLFAVEVEPPNGSVLIIERRTPDNIDTVMDLQ